MVSASLPIYLSDASLPHPDHKDKLSVLAGGLKRLGARVHPVLFREMKRILYYARKYLMPRFKTFQPDEVPATLDWIDNINHPESRKKQLREVYHHMVTHGTIPEKTDGSEDIRTCESFIKDEAYEEEKALRWINSSLDAVKVAFGPIADKCMESLVACESMIKTVPVEQRASTIWHDMGGFGVVAQSSDATAMEDHYAHFSYIDQRGVVRMSDPRYRISNDFMLYMCGEQLVPLHLLKSVKFIFCKTVKHIKEKHLVDRVWDRIEDAPTLRAFFKGVIDGYRTLEMRNFGYLMVNAILCSGEMNTSFKNTSTMYVMTNYAAYDLSRGRVTHVVSKNEGDDSLAVYPELACPDENWWKSKGWVVKIEHKGFVNEASFCGLVFDPEVLDSVPDIRQHLAKFGWTNRRYVHASERMRLSLLRSKALSMACEYGNVPILGPLAHRILYLTRTINIRMSIVYAQDQYKRERMLEYLKQKPWQRKPKINSKTRDLVFRLQGISVDVQLECERVVEKLNLYSSFSLPALDFNPIWIHNMSRCHTSKYVDRQLVLPGRSRVVLAIEDWLRTSFVPGSTWSAPILSRMFEDLELLKRGSI